MARVTTTRYVCDACAKDVERPRDLTHIQIINHGRAGRAGWNTTTTNQLCEACISKLLDKLDEFGFDVTTMQPEEARWESKNQS